MSEETFNDRLVATLSVKGVFRVDTDSAEVHRFGALDRKSHLQVVGAARPQDDFETEAELRLVEWRFGGLAIPCSVIQYDGVRYAIEKVISGEECDLSFMLKTTTIPLVLLIMNVDIKSRS